MVTTEKMIDYATAIAKELNLKMPDFSNYNETSIFIDKYCQKYNKKMSDKRISEMLVDLDFERLSTEFLHIFNMLEHKKGVYVFWNNNEIVYIGKSLNLQERICTSLKERLSSTEITHFFPIVTDNEADMHILEVVLITEYKPLLNIDCNCKDKSNRFSSGLNLYTRKKYPIFKDFDYLKNEKSKNKK